MKYNFPAAILIATTIVATLPINASAQGGHDYPRYDDSCGYDGPADYGDQSGVLGLDDFSLAEIASYLRDSYNPVRLKFIAAGVLATQETVIGIRSDQQDEWRAYSNAVLAMLPAKNVIDPLLIDNENKAESPKAFVRAEQLADSVLAYTEKAQALKRAIGDLRGKLSPEQLESARFPRPFSQ